MSVEQHVDGGDRRTRHRPPGPWWRDDRGAGTIEYQGILVVAALLIGAVVSSVFFFPDHAQHAACQVASAFGGDGGCAPVASADGPTDAELQPGVCMLSQTSSGGGVGLDIGFVTLGGDWKLEVTEFNDEYHATVVNGASAGVKAEAEIASGVVDASVSGSLEGTYQHGDTWIVPKEAWPAFERDARDYFSQSKWRWFGAGNLWGAREPRSPDVTSHQGGAQMEVGAGAKVDVPNEGGDPGKGGSLTGASASASAAGAASVKRETNSVDDTVTWVFSADGRAQAEAGVLVAGAGASISRSGSIAVEYSAADMVVQKITFETVARGGAYADFGLDGEVITQTGGRHAKPDPAKGMSLDGDVDTNDVVVTTTTLEVTRENRAVVEAWLERSNDGWTADLPFEPVIPSAPSEDDALMQELYRSGKTSRTVYDATDTSGSAGVSAKAGVGAGVEISGSEGERHIRSAEFLGSPRADGERPFLANSSCE